MDKAACAILWSFPLNCNDCVSRYLQILAVTKLQSNQRVDKLFIPDHMFIRLCNLSPIVDVVRLQIGFVSLGNVHHSSYCS